MKKTIAIFAAFALLAVAFAGCALPLSPQRLLAGKWQASAAGFEVSSFEFTPGEKDPLKGTVAVGLGPLSGLVNGTYTVTPGKGDAADRLEVTYTVLMISTTQAYTFTVSEDTLTLKGENSSLALTYARVTG